MDKKNNIGPAISELEISINFKLAMESQRKRHHKIIHEEGAEFNEVYNFMLKDSYMQPHLHPGMNKIEKIYVLQGKLALIFFNNLGEIDRVKKIFEVIGIKSKWCVEFGTWDGKYLSNAYNLISKSNWNGVLIESDIEKFEDSIRPDTILASVMHANNEIGIIIGLIFQLCPHCFGKTCFHRTKRDFQKETDRNCRKLIPAL